MSGSTTYTCAACGKTFEGARSDEEALGEARDLWGDIAIEDMVVICDTCFNGGIDDAKAAMSALK